MNIGKLIGNGRTSEVFELEDNKVLKLFREFMTKSMVENEYMIAKEVYDEGVVTPKPYEVVNIDKRYGIIYDRIDGETMLKSALSKPWLIGNTGKKLAELHKKMHVEVKGNFQSFKDILKDRISKVKQLDEKEKHILYNYINTLEDGDYICHGDFHPDNIILINDKVFVIDWMTGSKGSYLADVARTAVILRFAELPDDKSFIEKTIARIARNKLYKNYLKRYLEISNIDISDIEKWELPIASARLIEGGSKKENENLLNFIKDEIKKLN